MLVKSNIYINKNRIKFIENKEALSPCSKKRKNFKKKKQCFD